MLTLVTGGARSGKSRHAEALIAHAPQGVTGSGESAITSASAICVSPPATIAAIAPASAQVPTGKAAFSTLQPA